MAKVYEAFCDYNNNYCNHRTQKSQKLFCSLFKNMVVVGAVCDGLMTLFWFWNFARLVVVGVVDRIPARQDLELPEQNWTTIRTRLPNRRTPPVLSRGGGGQLEIPYLDIPTYLTWRSVRPLTRCRKSFDQKLTFFMTFVSHPIGSAPKSVSKESTLQIWNR